MLPIDLGDGFQIRRIEDSDAGELAALVDVNRAYLSRWMPWAPGSTIDDTREHIRRGNEQADRDDGFQAVIVSDGRIIGALGFHRIDRANRSTSLGYWLAESAQGRGTMTRAVPGSC